MGSNNESQDPNQLRAVSAANGPLSGFGDSSRMQAVGNVVAGGMDYFYAQFRQSVDALQVQSLRNPSIPCLLPFTYAQMVNMQQRSSAGDLLLMHQNSNAETLWANIGTCPQLLPTAPSSSSPPNSNSTTEATSGLVSLRVPAPETPNRVSCARMKHSQSMEPTNFCFSGRLETRHHQNLQVSSTELSNKPIHLTSNDDGPAQQPLNLFTDPFQPVTPSKEAFSLQIENCQRIDTESPLRGQDSLENEIHQSTTYANALKITQNHQKEGQQGIDLNKTPPLKPPRRKKLRPKVIREAKPKKTPPVTKQATKTPEVFPESHSSPSGVEAVEKVNYRKRRSSCRRVLNFNLETQTEEGSSGHGVSNKKLFSFNSQFQLQNASEHSALHRFGPFKNDHGHELQTRIDNSTAGQAFDHTHSLNEMLTEYISLPTSSNKLPPAYVLSPNASGKIAKENMKVLARKKNGIPRHFPEATECISFPPFPVGHECASQWANHLQQCSSLCSEPAPVNPAKRGMTRKYGEATYADSYYTANPPNFHLFSLNTNHQTIQSQHLPSSNISSNNRTGSDQLDDEAKENDKENKAKRKRSKTPVRPRQLFSVVDGGTCFSSSQAFLHINQQEVCLEALLAQEQMKPTTKKRRSRSRTISLSNKTRQVPNTICQIQGSLSSAGSIDEITHRLTQLNIHKDDVGKIMIIEEAYALVPYNVGGQMVPYQGPFDVTKRKHRPKVNLDDETNRVWRLLMWEEGKDREMNEEKEKWWEAERQVFLGRVDSFIARMHCVQGDRRFSQWKGSVVDSVIGVFLTQNVSDHLSSSAFMALAARFPPQSRANNQLIQGASKSQAEPEINALDFEKLLDKMPHKEIGTEGSKIQTETMEDKEAASCTESTSNMLPNLIDNQKGKGTSKYQNGLEMSQESIEDKTDRSGAVEDIISSQNSVTSSHSSTDSLIQKQHQIGSSSESNIETEKPERENKSKGFSSTYIPSFMELLQMQGASIDREASHLTIYQCKPIQDPFRTTEAECIEVYGDESSSSIHSLSSGITEIFNIFETEKASSASTENVAHSMALSSSCLDGASICGSCSPTSKHSVQVKPGSEYQNSTEAQTNNHESGNILNFREKVMDLKTEPKNCGSKTGPNKSDQDLPTSKKQRRAAAGKKNVDWDSLRQDACQKNPRKERTSDTMDSLDYEALIHADVSEISNAIRERGMNNMLAERIKDFLNRLVHEHGSVDLEWLRDVPPDKAKDYLLSIRGLGLKSVECVRLLTLHQHAFPVDTNVGRICVRLGWVPLQPLPEFMQLHLLELYPVLESIQKYLWPRLCKLDQRTLYELHYQMITFGKVFCTKSNPNCNACPMRAECRHFASAFASAKLALPAPEEKTLVTRQRPPVASAEGSRLINPMPLPASQMSLQLQAQSVKAICEPIIEEPPSPEPEPESTKALETAIEDAFWEEDPDDIPTIKLNIAELSQNVQNYMRENNMELESGNVSKALVALTPEAASIPMPKLKNVSRLRTEHHVYELPDSHILLTGLDQREPDDPCPYLLAIWTPGETAQSIEPPEQTCTSAGSGYLCEKEICFACNSIREANAQTVRGTILIPCRTAMRGSFPLNGTYFQVNEVFADHESSLEPIHIPRTLIWNLPRRTVYFGTSVPTIFKGLTTEGIQQCFWRGFVCVRGFDQRIRAPRPLTARLHFPASKLAARKKDQKRSSEN